MFVDRADAARKLLDRLPPFDPAATAVIALPRGGLPLADVIAQALHLPLDIVLVRKVGMPGQPEFAAGAVTDAGGVAVTVNPAALEAGLTEERVRAMARDELAELRRRRALYQGGRAPLPVKGKTVLVVDDGIATGATMRAALRLLRAAGAARLVLAVPVAPADVLADLARDADETICLETPAPFFAVGMHYQTFDQVSDAEAAEILRRHAR